VIVPNLDQGPYEKKGAQPWDGDASIHLEDVIEAIFGLVSSHLD
jgi:hypothetical protein